MHEDVFARAGALKRVFGDKLVGEANAKQSNNKIDGSALFGAGVFLHEFGKHEKAKGGYYEEERWEVAVFLDEEGEVAGGGVEGFGEDVVEGGDERYGGEG